MKHRPGPLVTTLAMTVLGGTLSSAANAASDLYQQPNKEETVGLMSGALIGAAAGGPPGAVVGAALGIFIGDSWITKREYREIEAAWISVKLDATQAKAELAALQLKNQSAKDELARLRDAPTQVLPTFLNSPSEANPFSKSEISLHFRTGSSTVEPHYRPQLTAMASIADQLTTGAIEIYGYADRNGDADANLRLSEIRAASVKSFIEDLGLESAGITTVGYGESRPLHDTQSLETDFFDRRVIVRLIDNSQQFLTESKEE
ncbi:MAG TPA: hypothetical protein DEF79_02755 [Gammaproteobacteria bacterium]|nr:hypothetical protein [Gammaproteobacteria bacterium]